MSKYYLNTNILTSSAHGGPVSHVSLLTPSTECCKNVTSEEEEEVVWLFPGKLCVSVCQCVLVTNLVTAPCH